MTDTHTPTRAELLRQIEDGWNKFQAYLKTLTHDQLTKLTDAQGWTVKDHLTHLVVWEDSMNALLAKQLRSASMGLDEATWKSGDFDRQNAVIQQHHKDKPLDEVLKKFQEAHQQLVAKIQSLTDADLARPYRDFEAGATSDRPVYQTIAGNTFAHYEEHQPWIEAIVNQGGK